MLKPTEIWIHVYLNTRFCLNERGNYRGKDPNTDPGVIFLNQVRIQNLVRHKEGFLEWYSSTSREVCVLFLQATIIKKDKLILVPRYRGTLKHKICFSNKFQLYPSSTNKLHKYINFIRTSIRILVLQY